MSFASADLVLLGYAREAVAGQINAAADSRKLRMTGESLAFDITKTDDKEITGDGQPNSSSISNATAGGDINVHMQYAEYDPFIAGVLRTDWTVHGTNGVSAEFEGDFTATSIIADVAPTGVNAFTNLQRGQWLRVNCPDVPENDGQWVRLSSTVSPTATVLVLDPSTPLTADTSAEISIATARLANGMALSSFTVEKQITDKDQFFTFTGMHPSKLSLSMAAESDTTGSISLMGYKATRKDESQLPGDLAEAHTFDIHSGVVGVGHLWEDGAPTSEEIKSLSLDVDSALRYQTALGKLGAVGMGIGTINVSGSVTIYFENGDLYDKYEKDIYTSLVFSTRDTKGNGYVITLPRVMLTKGTIVAGGKDSDLMAEFQFSAKADRANPVPALRKVIFIDRLGEAVEM